MFKFLFGGILGFAGGAFAMLIVFPFIFPPPEVNETFAMAAEAQTELAAEGRFAEDSPGRDAAHWGMGSLKVYDVPGDLLILEIQSDFEVGPGPNFWIYLNKTSPIGEENDFKRDAERFKVAKLKSFAGSQVYEIDRAQFESAEAITIWCESFNQFIASAELVRVPAGG